MKVKRAPLGRIKQFISRLSQRALDIDMCWYVVFFAVVVFVSGCFYTYLTPGGNGIGQNLEPLSEVTFLQGIYFSIITVSSLGYGDMHPMGISKALICIEVLLGLAMIGIMIAKVTSQSMSHQVSRLFSSDAQKRLEDIAAKFDTSRVALNKIMPLIVAVYQSTPSQTSLIEEDRADRSTLISNFQEVISEFRSECIELRDYFSDEIKQDNNYFKIAPTGAMVRTGNATDEAFFTLGQLIRSLPPQVQVWEEILERDNRQRILEAIDSQEQVCNLVDQHATDQKTQDVFRRIEETCEQLRASYFAVPQESDPEKLQPNQIPQTDEPQELSGGNEHTDSP